MAVGVWVIVFILLMLMIFVIWWLYYNPSRMNIRFPFTLDDSQSKSESSYQSNDPSQQSIPTVDETAEQLMPKLKTKREKRFEGGYLRPFNRDYSYDPVPVPSGSLKMTSELYGPKFYSPKIPLETYDYFQPIRDTSGSVIDPRSPFRTSDGIIMSINGIQSPTNMDYVSSVNAFFPKPEVSSKYEKIGLLIQENPKGKYNTKIMNLYRRPIAPLQDLFEYVTQDRDGFLIPLVQTKYLEDGDILKNITGKPGLWKAKIFVNDKYVFM